MATTTETLTSIPSQTATQYDFKNLSPYIHPPETTEKLDWAELVTLDLKDYDRVGGKERLAKQLHHAVHHIGFFYVKNFGLTQEQIDQQFTIAKSFFALPIEEKAKHEIDYANADYNGWRKSGPNAKNDVQDPIEIFNIPKFTKDFEGKYSLPALIKAHLPEIEFFSKTLHANVVLPLLRLFAVVLELPDEEYLVRQHTYEKKSEDHFRYMLYRKRTPEEHAAQVGRKCNFVVDEFPIGF